MPNSFNAPNVICPFYHKDLANKIVCESAIPGALSMSINFKSSRDVLAHIESFCGDECYRGCPLYQAINAKYEE